MQVRLRPVNAAKAPTHGGGRAYRWAKKNKNKKSADGPSVWAKAKASARFVVGFFCFSFGTFDYKICSIASSSATESPLRFYMLFAKVFTE